jgi:hypothetical protein
LADYEFIVVNKLTLTPLVWKFRDTTTRGTIVVGKPAHPIELRDPEDIGNELKIYLAERPQVPFGIVIGGSNDLTTWLNKL